MLDYRTLLLRAIETLPDRDPARRQAVYRRAREALERQLRSLDPPLTDDEILKETLTLEDVILRIEADFAEMPPETPAGSPAPDAGLPAPFPAMPQTPRRLPSHEEGEKSPRRLASWAMAGGIAIIAMGMIAYWRKEDPENFRRGTAPITRPDVVLDGDPMKREGRLTDDTPARAEAPPANAPGGNPAMADRPVLPVLGRAFMVLETQGAAPNQFEGNANWSFGPDPVSPGGEKVLRARMEYPGAGLSIEMVLARNNDAGIPASHTFFVTFNPRNGLPPVREMGQIEWRERESQVGPAMAGPVVPIQDNVFLMGLDRSETAIQRNIDLLRFQRWMVFDVRLANGRRAAFLIEKGPLGDKAVADALAAWK